jgi:hypothetical protein
MTGCVVCICVMDYIYILIVLHCTRSTVLLYFICTYIYSEDVLRVSA